MTRDAGRSTPQRGGLLLGRRTYLNQELDGDLLVMGSGELLRSLMPHHLVDEYRLLIQPLVLGRGNRLFDQGVPCARFQMVESEVTKTGAIMATYRPTVQR